MKISCSKENLQSAVQTIQKAIATKTPLPILTGIYLHAKDGQLELQATDYEIGMSCIIPATVEKNGITVLSGRYFQELVRRLPGENVEISMNQEDRTIKVVSNNAQFNLLCLPAEEFPVLKPLSNENMLVVKDSTLKDLIKKTIFACSTDEARPIFTGGLLEAQGKDIRMVATNTHRLAFRKGIIEDFSGNIRMIIPSKILAEMARLLTSEIPTDINIYWSKNQVAFAFDNIYIISRIIEGQFPDYNKVIPESFETKVRINTSQFSDAVDRVSLLARDGEYNIVKFNFKNDVVIITSNNPDVGKAYETVEASMDGNEIEIAFNSKYVSDILKNINSEELIFSLNTALSPACINPINEESYVYVITPVRTN